ncbi:MAG: hypothetical protein KDA81_01185 [Planctomycetaceae bacterium]|nr:hypothetical protein [Planctomycetaceae bacterium]
MSGLSQNIVYVSLVIAALMAVAAIADLATGALFGGQSAFDVLFILGAGITIFMAVDCIRKAR